MVAYLVYNADYMLYEIHEQKPVYRYDIGWYSEGYKEGVSPSHIPGDTQKVLADKGMLKVITTPMVLFHTDEKVHFERVDEEDYEYIQHIDKEGGE